MQTGTEDEDVEERGGAALNGAEGYECEICESEEWGKGEVE